MQRCQGRDSKRDRHCRSDDLFDDGGVDRTAARGFSRACSRRSPATGEASCDDREADVRDCAFA